MAKIKLNSNQIKAVRGGTKRFFLLEFKDYWHLCRRENGYTKVLFSHKEKDIAFFASIAWMDEICDAGGLDAIKIIGKNKSV